MSIKTSLLTIISVVVVTATAAALTASNAEKLDTDSAGSLATSLAATAETFTSFNQNAPATATSSPLSGAKTPKALFPLSDAESDATAAAFLPWLLLTRFKRRLAQHHIRKRNRQNFGSDALFLRG